MVSCSTWLVSTVITKQSSGSSALGIGAKAERIPLTRPRVGTLLIADDHTRACYASGLCSPNRASAQNTTPRRRSSLGRDHEPLQSDLRQVVRDAVEDDQVRWDRGFPGNTDDLRTHPKGIHTGQALEWAV